MRSTRGSRADHSLTIDSVRSVHPLATTITSSTEKGALTFCDRTDSKAAEIPRSSLYAQSPTETETTPVFGDIEGVMLSSSEGSTRGRLVLPLRSGSPRDP